jgi:hypothetical protein
VAGQDDSRGNPFPQNAVQEYQVLTQNYKAEYEKSAAAVITAVTKSGGNEMRPLLPVQDKNMITLDDFTARGAATRSRPMSAINTASLGGPIIGTACSTSSPPRSTSAT